MSKSYALRLLLVDVVVVVVLIYVIVEVAIVVKECVNHWSLDSLTILPFFVGFVAMVNATSIVFVNAADVVDVVYGKLCVGGCVALCGGWQANTKSLDKKCCCPDYVERSWWSIEWPLYLNVPP